MGKTEGKWNQGRAIEKKGRIICDFSLLLEVFFKKKLSNRLSYCKRGDWEAAWRVGGCFFLRSQEDELEDKPPRARGVPETLRSSSLLSITRFSSNISYFKIAPNSNTSTSWQRWRSQGCHFPQRLKPGNIWFMDTSNRLSNAVFNPTANHNGEGRQRLFWAGKVLLSIYYPYIFNCTLSNWPS